VNLENVPAVNKIGPKSAPLVQEAPCKRRNPGPAEFQRHSANWASAQNNDDDDNDNNNNNNKNNNNRKFTPW